MFRRHITSDSAEVSLVVSQDFGMAGCAGFSGARRDWMGRCREPRGGLRLGLGYRAGRGIQDSALRIAQGPSPRLSLLGPLAMRPVAHSWRAGLSVE